MYGPLEDAAAGFTVARDSYITAYRAGDTDAGIKALIAALSAADALLTFLGYVDPYECGDCDNCQANAAARRAEVQTAVDADPELSPSGTRGPVLSEIDEDTVRRLIGDVFGPGPVA